MHLRKVNRVQGKTHCRSEHMSEVTWRGSGHFCSDTETLCKYPRMDHLRIKTSSGSTVLRTCRIAWESGSVRGRYRRQNASWWRTSRGLGWPTSSLKSKDHRTDVQTRFLRRPIGAGKGGKAPGKALRHNSALSNYRYSAVPAFNIRIWSSLYYPCFVIMSSGETVHAVPIALGDRLARHASLTLCLPFLCRYKC
jgi:hypothetical protein